MTVAPDTSIVADAPPDVYSTSVLLKVLKAGGVPPMAGNDFRWSLPTPNDDGTWTPGEWHKVTGKVIPCERGYHLCRVSDLPEWIRYADEVYVAEAKGETIFHDDSKIVVRTARLTQRLAFSASILRTWAADCAERALPIYERRYPNDMRPRRAIKAARAYVRGEITREALQAAREEAWKARSASSASSAYYAAAAVYAALSAVAAHAAHAASASALAAYYAAADAASALAAYYAAADAAPYAADAAPYAADARRQERAWQAARLATLLGVPGYTLEAAS